MSCVACLCGHNTTETPTKPLSFLFPSSAAFVGQMSIKHHHNFSFVGAFLYFKPLYQRWNRSGLLKAARSSSVSKKCSCVLTLPVELWDCTRAFCLRSEHHVKLCLRWLAEACVGANGNKHACIRLFHREYKTTHLTCISEKMLPYVAWPSWSCCSQSFSVLKYQVTSSTIWYQLSWKVIDLNVIET